MWTFWLTLTGLTGMALVPFFWWAWLIYLLNESIWLAYGLETRSHPIIVMSLLWGAVGLWNLGVTSEVVRPPNLRYLRAHLRRPGSTRRAVADNLRRVLDQYAGRGPVGAGGAG